MFNKILHLLAQMIPLSADLENAIKEKTMIESFPKKHMLLRQGMVSDYIYFVGNGLLRAFYAKNEEEITRLFLMENDIVISVLSFFRRTPAFETIETLEDCDLAYIHYDDLLSLYSNFIEFNIVGRILTEQYYCRSEERLIAMRKNSATERYEDLLSNSPEIIKRVPGKYIASYLGMTVETYSRIRSSIR